MPQWEELEEDPQRTHPAKCFGLLLLLLVYLPIYLLLLILLLLLLLLSFTSTSRIFTLKGTRAFSVAMSLGISSLTRWIGPSSKS